MPTHYAERPAPAAPRDDAAEHYSFGTIFICRARALMTRLHIGSAVLERIRSEGEQAYPLECCGVLVGRPVADGWTVEAAVRVVNSAQGPHQNRYSIAPAELVKIMKQARTGGLEIAGFYHSHPDHPAQWSATDLAEAHWIGCSYVITEIVRGKAAITNSFHLLGATEEDKHFVADAIEVIE
jgi:proteasome lid subunit RPN8/RPN11